MKIHNRHKDPGAMPNVMAEGDEEVIRRLGNNAVAVRVMKPVKELVNVNDPDTGEAQYRDLGGGKKGKRLKRWQYKRDENGEVVKKEERYAKVGDRRGFVRKIPNFEPTPEEIARNTRKGLEQKMREELAAELTAAGITPSELVNAVKALREGNADAVSVSTPEDVLQDGEGDDSEYPIHKGGPWWILSDGNDFKGSKEAAFEAERELQELGDPALAG